MSYSDFTIDDFKGKFQLEWIEDQRLFSQMPDYTVPSELRVWLEKFLPLALAIDTEKARSEFIVASILADKIQKKSWQF